MEEISSILGTSPKTIQRRAKEWNLPTFSSISDSELDSIIRDLLSQSPTLGEIIICGHLKSRKVINYYK